MSRTRFSLTRGDVLTDERLNALIHDKLFGPWDESKCRMCGLRVAQVNSSFTGTMIVCGWLDNGDYRCGTYDRGLKRADGVIDYMGRLREARRIADHEATQVRDTEELDDGA